MSIEHVVLQRFKIQDALFDSIRLESICLMKDLAKQKLLTQQLIADLLNIDKATFSRIIKRAGNKVPVLEEMVKYFPCEVWVELVYKEENLISINVFTEEDLLQSISPNASKYFEEMTQLEWLELKRLRKERRA